ncbi:DUF3817 domain-containing protein [Moraxella oblonga]|uniref:DUF3817 domain-containing protein n=1 Tax=Moraxella oblonga TaxID=200413 RepID=UPI000A93B786|nr:DUF3817 domain-containing protein [Moraxella oblonga]
MTTFLRIVSFLEGVSFILLLGIAMPLKYMFDKPFLVFYAGIFHGVMFLVFVVSLLVVCQVKGWSLKVFLLGFVASFIPLMPFWFERHIYKLDLQDDEELE